MGKTKHLYSSIMIDRAAATVKGTRSSFLILHLSLIFFNTWGLGHRIRHIFSFVIWSYDFKSLFFCSRVSEVWLPDPFSSSDH